MRRRAVFAGLGAGSVACLLPLRRSIAQQQTKVPRIGWLWYGGSGRFPQENAGFRQGLKELGDVEGLNVIVDHRYTEGQPDRIAPLMKGLIESRPDVLIGFGAPAALGWQYATEIPVVFLASDPVGIGLVKSLARPGGHMTGVSMMQGAEGLGGKRIEFLMEALPAATRLGIMINPEYSAGALAQVRQIAAQRGLSLVEAPVRRQGEIDEAVAKLRQARVDAAYVEPSGPLTAYAPEIARALLQNGIPTVSELRSAVEAGGLLSYGPNIFDASRRLPYFVDRILKGAKPADLPVVQATRLELVINMKTAKLLGIELPQRLLERADERME